MSSSAQYADAVWLDYQEGLPLSGDTIMTDVQVEDPAPNTRYGALFWNTGYFALEQEGVARSVSIVLWDPSGGGVSEIVWADSEVTPSRASGEGTSSVATWPFSWSAGQTYRLCVRLSHTNSATYYDSYFFDPAVATWKHLVTFRRNDGPHSFSYVASSLQDFGNSLSTRRSCLFDNAWLRAWEKNWTELRTAKFASAGSQTNKDAEVYGDWFRLETGGSTTNDTALYTPLVRPAAPTAPNNQDLTIRSTDLGDSVVLHWQTLPWRNYAIEWTTALNDWTAGVQHPTSSNLWTEGVGSNAVNFFRTISTE